MQSAQKQPHRLLSNIQELVKIVTYKKIQATERSAFRYVVMDIPQVNIEESDLLWTLAY